MKGMKKAFLFIVLFCCCCSLVAQHRTGPKFAPKSVGVGLVVGGNLASFAYHGDSNKQSLGFDSLLYRIRPIAGVAVEIPLGNYFYVAPEVLWSGRGDARLFESAIWNNNQVRYLAKTYYLEMQVPMSLVIPASKTVQPYVFVAPGFGLTLPMGGIIQQSLDKPHSFSHSVAIDSSNMALYDASLMAGAGMRFNLDFSTFYLAIKLEAGYHYGFLDTYSPMEHNDMATAVNVNAYNVKGKRLNRGWEMRLSVVLPLKFPPGDACSGWSRDVYPLSRKGNRFSF